MTPEMLKKQADTLNRDYADAIVKARTFEDNDLTPEALMKRRAHHLASTQQAHAEKAEKLRTDASTAVYYTEGRLSRPSIDWDSSASIAKAEAKWRHAQELMTAGMTLDEVIATADTDMLAALYENAPQLLKVQAVKDGRDLDTLDLTPIQNALDKRAAAVTGNAGLREHREALAAQQYVRVIVDHITTDRPDLHDSGVGLDVMTVAREQKAAHEAQKVLA